MPLKKLIKPVALQAGDRIATVSLSWGGPHSFPHRYEAGKKQLEDSFGVSVVEMPHTLKSADWIYKNPQARVDDLMMAFSDPDIKGIFSTIGGDDSIRMLPYINYDIIRQNPKIFLGYSDTTISHFACLKAGLRSYYGPTIMAGFGENGGLFPYMERSIQKTLFSNEPIGEIHANSNGWTDTPLSWKDPQNQNKKRPLTPPLGPQFLQGSGISQGRLIGGCAEVLEFMKGTPLWPELNTWDNAILFLETSEDQPPVEFFIYWLRNYAAMGILERLKGLILGRPGGHIEKNKIQCYDHALLKVIRDEYGLTNLPIITQMDFGHTDPMFTLPFGALAEIDCDQKRFSILESGAS